MSKRKGVSAEEKRVRLLDLFYEKKEFFQLKELEKIAPKEKGIVSQSVKEILQSLVDDGLVDTDKIGSSIYFWAFPGKAKAEKTARLESIRSDIDVFKDKITKLTEELENRKGEEDEVEEKRVVMQKLTELEQTKEQLLKEIAGYSCGDPERIQDNITNIKNAANRWTDNIYATRSWCTNKVAIDEETLNKHFGIPEDLDYVDI